MLVVLVLIASIVPAGALPPKVPSLTAADAAYVEALGAGLLLSLNYDRRLDEQYGIRIGGLPSSPSYWVFAQGYMLTGGTSSHHLELGAGLGVMVLHVNLNLFGYSSASEPTPLVYVPFNLGYRLQPADGGFLFRIGFTPLLAFGRNEAAFLPWGGASIGWCW